MNRITEMQFNWAKGTKCGANWGGGANDLFYLGGANLGGG